MSDRPRFVLVLQPLPNVDGIRALRRALKCLLRTFGLRAVSVERADGAPVENINLKPGGAS